MKEETLRKIKEDYEKGKERRERLLEIYKEVSKLEEDETIKKYHRLKKELNKYYDIESKLRETDSQILNSAFYSNQYLIKDIDTNDIYLCMGTFKLDSICDIVHGPSDIRLKRDDPRAEYRIYRNIENGYSQQISIRNCEEFERKHKVIISKYIWTDQLFYEIQGEFIKSAINEGQEEAKRKILSRYKSN